MEVLKQHFAGLKPQSFQVKSSLRIKNPAVNSTLSSTMNKFSRAKSDVPPYDCKSILVPTVFTKESPGPADIPNLNADENHVIHGCKFGAKESELRLIESLPIDKNNPISLNFGNNIVSWSDVKIEIKIPVKPIYSFVGYLAMAKPNTSEFNPVSWGNGVYGGVYVPKYSSNSVPNIPQGSISTTLSPAGSPYPSSPMSFYGLNAAFGVARQSPNGLLPGQDVIQLTLAKDVLLESVQIQYLTYSGSGDASVVNGTPAQNPVIQQALGSRKATIIVNWPVSSVTSPGQSQSTGYSVYGLNITLKGPEGLPQF
jgi:hypothetical protein